MIGNCSLRGSTSLTAPSRQLLAPNTSTMSKLNLVLDGSDHQSLSLNQKFQQSVIYTNNSSHTNHNKTKTHSIHYKKTLSWLQKKLYNSSHKKITQIIKQNKIAPKSSQKIFKKKQIIEKNIIIYKPLPKKSHQ